MMQRILVTGATGNVGTEVVKHLQDSAYQVVVGVRDIARARSLFGPGLEYVQLDFRQPATFEDALKDVQKIFLVRPPDISNIKKYITPFVAAARQAHVVHIVFLSLLGVEKNRVVPHYKIEKTILGSGIDWTFLRASFFMQNLNTTHRDDIKERHQVYIPAGRGKTSFIDVRDIGAVAAKALTEDGHQNRAYPLTGNVALDYYQVARELTQVLGRPIRYSNPSPITFGWQMYKRKIPISFIIVMLGIYTTARFGLAATVTPDTERLLGRPPLTVRQYIEDYKQFWL